MEKNTAFTSATLVSVIALDSPECGELKDGLWMRKSREKRVKTARKTERNLCEGYYRSLCPLPSVRNHRTPQGGNAPFPPLLSHPGLLSALTD
ncbi:hypothetical protein TNCV_2404101 [Trichonephila clavipes]|nr:hypothetical protein TNCV_2404101 [Trichonephila clavipes]